MFDNFRTKFKISANNAGEGFALLESAPSVTGFAEFMGEFSGCTFNDGLYRVHTAASSRDLTPLVIEQFPKFKGRILPFGYDWIGRQFAVDFGRRENGEPLVLLLEADTGDALGIPQTFMAFHESEIVEYDDALLAELYREWAGQNPAAIPLAHDQCVGFRVPLFLGGDDTVDNLEVTNLSVHWSMSAQLWQSTRDLPPGTSVRDVEIE